MNERFPAQLLAGPPARCAVDVVERILAVQGQDPRGFRLAVRARSRGLTAADVDAALGDRSLLVTWLNRGTLHLVRSEDYWWLHALTTPPLLTGCLRRLSQCGVSPSAAERGVEAVTKVLESGPATRTELRPVLEAAGVAAEGQGQIHLLFLVSLRGIAVRGPMAGREHAYVAVRDWLGEPPPFDRDAALAELARRYLLGHAPASDRDLANWAGLPLRDARRGLAALSLRDRGDGLVSLRGVSTRAAVPPPRLLGSFDPVLHGWVSREPVVGPHLADIVSGGIFRPFALVDGRAAGTWRYQGGRVALTPFAPLPPEDVAALDADARDVERYLYGT